MQLNRAAVVWLVALTVGLPAMADIKTETVEYKLGDITFKGYLAYDPAIEGKRPAVLVYPEWWGLNDYSKNRAIQLAKLGYVAFAADMYGDGKTTDSAEEAARLATEARRDIDVFRARAMAALDTVRGMANVDGERIGAVGYCFGGACVLELARAGAPLVGVVSFHGSLGSPKPAKAGEVKAAVLVCNGADDEFVQPAEIAAFQAEMRTAGVDWRLIQYGGAVHSFTNPEADARKMRSVGYNAAADRRSWTDMKAFFTELFAAK